MKFFLSPFAPKYWLWEYEDYIKDLEIIGSFFLALEKFLPEINTNFNNLEIVNQNI